MDSLLDIQPLRTTAAHTQVSFNIYPSICKSSARIHEHENVYICMRMRPCVLGLRFNLKSAGKPEHICHPHGFLLFHQYSQYFSFKQIPQLQNRKLRVYLISFVDYFSLESTNFTIPMYKG